MSETQRRRARRLRARRVGVDRVGQVLAGGEWLVLAWGGRTCDGQDNWVTRHRSGPVAVITTGVVDRIERASGRDDRQPQFEHDWAEDCRTEVGALLTQAIRGRADAAS